MQILVIEDDEKTGQLVCSALARQGHKVTVAREGCEGLKLAMVEAFDVLIVDRMLPGIDGIDIIEHVRKADSHAGIIVLTAVGGIEDRIQGLETGADDYLVKPFAIGELTARVAALGRRPPAPKEETAFKVATLTVDLVTREVRRGGEVLHLQPREFKILQVFLKNRGHLVTRSMLLEQVWGLERDTRSSIVQTNVSRLRSRVDRPGDVPLIRTVRGLGYILDDAS